MKEPGDFARDTSQFAIPDGSGDRFSGYAVIGLPFSSGHVLALRRFRSVFAWDGVYLGMASRSEWSLDLPSERAAGAVLPPLLRSGDH